MCPFNALGTAMLSFVDRMPVPIKPNGSKRRHSGIAHRFSGICRFAGVGLLLTLNGFYLYIFILRIKSMLRPFITETSTFIVISVCILFWDFCLFSKTLCKALAEPCFLFGGNRRTGRKNCGLSYFTDRDQWRTDFDGSQTRSAHRVGVCRSFGLAFRRIINALRSRFLYLQKKRYTS